MRSVYQFSNELSSFIQKRGIVISKGFELSSGEISNYYYDIKSVCMIPRAMKLISTIMHFQAALLEIKSIGTTEETAYSMVGGIVCHNEIKNSNCYIEGFIIRDKPHTHGLEGEVIGRIKEPAMLIDDVSTTGKTLIKSIHQLRNFGKEVKACMVVIDRSKDTKEKLKNLNVEFYSIFNHSYFEDHIQSLLVDRGL